MNRPMKAETSLTSTAMAHLLIRHSAQVAQVEMLTVIGGVRHAVVAVREAAVEEDEAAPASFSRRYFELGNSHGRRRGCCFVDSR
jgi:hypothetical protein